MGALSGINQKDKKCINYMVYRRGWPIVHRLLVIWPKCKDPESCGIVVDCWQWFRAWYCPRTGFSPGSLVRPKADLPGGGPWNGGWF